jgi:transposase InsO family protein
MSPKRKHYPKEFKVETVKLVTEGGYSAAQVARDMGISTKVELLHHSDRGSQYASGEYQKVVKTKGIRCSMSRRGNCYDNSPM